MRRSRRTKHQEARETTESNLGQMQNEQEAKMASFRPYPANHDMLIPYPIDIEKRKVPTTPAMDEGFIPKTNQSTILIGASGSGKTTCLTWMLTHQHLMPMSLFDQVYLYSFTGKADKSFDVLHLKKENIFTTGLTGKMAEIFEKQKAKIEGKNEKDKKPIMMIFEDITSAPKVIRSPVFTRIMTAGRHYDITVICCGHKYTALSRVARLNAMNIIVYPSPGTEIQQIVEDHNAPAMHKKDMINLIKYAFTPTETMSHPFLYIAQANHPFATRYRKGFNEVLSLN